MDARKAHKYQVFLSFRGEDTRKGFTSHLHTALSDDGIRAFLDDNELERADFIKTQLEQAIDGSMISLIVFSKRYAESSWCLDELVKIMECRERLGQKVIPLFYKVEASDVRKQTGSFAQAFEKHEAGKHEKEKVQRWRNALSQAADLCGEDLKNADNGNEATFIKKILGVVNKYSKYQLDIEHPVGITSRMNVLSNYLDIENSGSKDVVLKIGILGMGGIGKTTLAKAIYNKFERSFEGRSFLANVREPINGLVGLQEQLLKDILKSKDPIKVDSVDVGITVIQERLHRKRALVIIDDVDDLQQLKAIARDHDWFGPGSKIIITTRDQHLLQQAEVDSTYMVEEMDAEEALELFSWHAFKRGYPDPGYFDLSKRVIHYCQGLPLALEVLGSFLNKRTALQWESQLVRLEKSPHQAITKILRISFDGLPDDTDRKTFLDISCFFIGMDQDYVTQILDGCDFSATLGIPILIERCLVIVSKENKLMMHDLLREMGRKIVCENAGGDLEKFSRLWKREDVTNVLSVKSGTEKIEGVALDLESSSKASFSAQTFSNMKKLRLLHLSNVELTGEYKDFPKELTWLCWHQFHLESIPDEFPNQPKLVALDLQYSKLKIVWKDCKLHQNLKILNLSYSYKLTKSPDFSKLPNLEELILQSCWSLSEVHSSIGDLGRLSSVNLEDCEMLKDLPLNFYKSKSIETLLLNGCRSFEKLAEGLGDMVSLTTLKADRTAIRQIPSSIFKLKKLEVLSLFNVRLTDDTIPNLFHRVKVWSNYIENSGSKDDVHMIGIWGIGGIGKTTLAKAIYNKFVGSFEGGSFLANVREVQRSNGLVGLQKQLLNDILKSEGIMVGSVDEGITVIQERLCCKRALVIIDDADDLRQLKAIAGARNWFGPGSRIVITTRNKHLLDQVDVDSTYMAQEMDEEEALELFSRHAFESGYPDQEYRDLSKRVICCCFGLPLSLRVVGSFLFNRSIADWESHLEKLERSPGNIREILRTCFDWLPNDTTREIFLDISCFFIGMDKDYVTQILNGNGFSATIGISVLIERCLVTVSEQKKLMMHDLLRDLGRDIVYENAHGRPEKFSRLWKREYITDVLIDESGTEKIEGVALDLESSYKASFSAQTFTKMKKLRLLHLSNVELTGEYKDFPKKLIWLCWHYFPLESIPDDFPVQPELVALDLQYSNLKIVWKDCKLHQNLKILNLSHSCELTKSPDFSKLPNVEELILEGCVSLSEVNPSIGDLGRLSLVNLKGCRRLRDLPLNFYKSKSIKTLILNGCSSFEKLAEGLGDMVSLTTLKADETAIRQIPSSIIKLKKLKALSLCYVKGSPSTNLLPPSLQSLSSLRELALANCSLTDDAVPKDLGSLISLEKLNLVNNDFCSLPSLSRLSQLQDLSLYWCKNLRAIPDLPTNLKVLRADGCIALEKMPDFSEMSNIRELYLSDSGKLTEIPGLDKSLNSMTRIHMEECTNLTADFRKNILRGWTSCGYGGIFLSGNDIPDWFDYVHDDDIVYFTVPQSDGRNLKGLTLSFVCSSAIYDRCCISIKNMTKDTELDAMILHNDFSTPTEYLWQGQLSNDELKLQDGDEVLIEIINKYDWGEQKVKKTGVSLVWDKFMNENLIDYHLCRYERCPSQNLINDDDTIRVENDNRITYLPDFSKFPNIKKLILKGCPRLYKVHSFIGDLGRLFLVNLEGCMRLRDLPLNFYKSKSIETLILNGCWSFKKLAEGLGDMVSLTTLKADNTRIRQIPSSIVKLKKLRILSLSGCRLTEDAIPKDICSLISLEDLLLRDNDFCSLPSLAGLSKLKVLCVNACRKLVAIPDLPTNLYVLHANGCPELETIPDFSKMWNLRELYLSDSFKLTEVPGLDKSLNSMTRIHMEGCTNLTADFRNRILQRWTSCGFGGIYLNGIYDIPEWFKFVNHVDNIVSFEVPPRIMGSDLKGLTICFVYSSDRREFLTMPYWSYGKFKDSQNGLIGIIVRNLTKQTALHTKIAIASLKTWNRPEDHYLWQGQLLNDVLHLEGGDHVSILVRPDDVDFVRVKKTGVHLEWDKVMKENMDNPDPHLYALETNGDFSGS